MRNEYLLITVCNYCDIIGASIPGCEAFVFLAALFCEVKGLDADAKYFLTRFVQCLGTADPLGLSVKALATRFGLSDRQVTKSLAALVACEVRSEEHTSELQSQ